MMVDANDRQQDQASAGNIQVTDRDVAGGLADDERDRRKISHRLVDEAVHEPTAVIFSNDGLMNSFLRALVGAETVDCPAKRRCSCFNAGKEIHQNFLYP